MKAMILAAGHGQRFQPQSFHLAKPALPLFDVPIIAHMAHYLTLMGASKFVINTHHLPETVHTAIAKLHLTSKVSWSFEPNLLNCGGGIYNVKDFFKGEPHLLVGNADSVLSAPREDFLSELLHEHKKARP